MKFILIMIWIGIGASEGVAIHSVSFRSGIACERARETFNNTRLGYSQRMAFCVKDD